MLPNVVPLMRDVFGNYVIQKFFEHGDQIQKKIMADAMETQVVKLSEEMYSCRVVQKVRTQYALH
jgi:mRNA-binding protein PUF3